MAITKAEFSGYSIVVDTDADLTVEKDVMAGPCRLDSITLFNNTTGTPTDVYIKLFDHLNPTAGTTEPDYVIEVHAGEVITIPCNPGTGFVFDTGLSFFASKEGGKSATAAPDVNLGVSMTLRSGVS